MLLLFLPLVRLRPLCFFCELIRARCGEGGVGIELIRFLILVKYALASGPLTVTMEHLLGFHNITPVHPSQLPPLHSHSEDESFIDPPPPPPPRSNSRFFLRVGITAVVTTLAIIIPDFGLILSFLGSCSAFLICAIGPLAAYLLIDRREKGIKVKVRMSEEEEGEELGLGMIEKVVCWILLGVSGVMAIIGTALVSLSPLSSLTS